MFTNTYNTIKKESKGFYTEKGSKFISYSFLVKSSDEVKNKIQYIKKIEKNADHYCYAYILNIDKSEYKTDDDGEPKSTAGLPILNQIKSSELTNILVIVVRYFGGTKLGIPGLIRSYKYATKEVINNSKIIEKEIIEVYKILFPYEITNNVMKIIKINDLKTQNMQINNDSFIIVEIAKNKADKVLEILKSEHKIKIQYLNTI